MNSNLKKFLLIIADKKNQRWIVGLVTLFFSIIFILVGNLANKPGFPLDDAWIHQTYARNLAQTGQWEFLPGKESAGSTSPLWTILLSIGFMFGFKTPFVWTSMLSTGMLIGTALVCNEILQHYFKKTPLIGMVGSLIVVMDWHLMWSAASGMETLFYCLASVYIFWKLISGKYWGWLGALCGLIVWIRPDGITMLGPVVVIIAIQIITKKFRYQDAILFFVTLFALIGLYGLFNYSISGSIFPNTYYAKQVEYVDVLMLPLYQRLGTLFLVPLSGAGILLVPGFIFSIITAIHKQNWWMITAVLWFFGYGIIYALRLPMTYQHGRYLIPMVPMFYLIGIIGTVLFFSRIKCGEKRQRNYSILVGVVLSLVSVVFVVFGEIALIDDIKTIDVLMVQPSQWIKKNTESRNVIAAHDIGAMGFFSKRVIIDLAGLIQPELIPIIRNEQEIQNYLIQSNADYLVLMEGWYPGLENLGIVDKTFSLDSNAGSAAVKIIKIR